MDATMKDADPAPAAPVSEEKKKKTTEDAAPAVDAATEDGTKADDATNEAPDAETKTETRADAPDAADAADAADSGEASTAAKDDAPAKAEDKPEASTASEEKKKEASEEEKTASAPTEEKSTEKTDKPEEKAENSEKSDDKTDEKADEKPAASAAAAAPAAVPTPTPSKSKSVSRRKSTGGKLNRKGSKARIVHLDAKPGDHFFVKLKGWPAWPVIVCDEEMLPETLLKTRPVTAARPDGSYREDYADGGKRAADRTFPVMYLYTNEFGWVPNQDLHDLDPAKVLDSVNEKMRKDLQQAHQLAAENNPLEYYKDMLEQHQLDLERAAEEAEAAAEAKRLAAAAKKAKKAAKEEDVDMLDVPLDDEELAAQKKSKKRKADEDGRTPQRTDSAKKPKIKITSSAASKASSTPTKSSAKTESKPKSNKPKAVPRESEMSEETKLDLKKKQVLFLRHRIQKGLLTGDKPPKPEDMKMLSDYLTKLETFADMDYRVIRGAKIHKLAKAIVKMQVIPREDEFQFKPRSQALLEKWMKILAAAPPPPPEEAKTEANGSSKTKESKDHKEHSESKDSKTAANGKANGAANGVSNGATNGEKGEAKEAAEEAELAETEGVEVDL